LLERLQEVTQRALLNPSLLAASTPTQPVVEKLLLHLELYRRIISFIVLDIDCEALCSGPILPVVFNVFPDEVLFVDHVFEREVQLHLTGAVDAGNSQGNVED